MEQHSRDTWYPRAFASSVDWKQAIGAFLASAGHPQTSESETSSPRILPPIRGVVLSFRPLIICDFDFQHSMRLSQIDHLSCKNEQLQLGVFGIELIEWRCVVDWEKLAETEGDADLSVDIACNTVRIWKDSDLLLDVDTIPPSLFSSPSLRSLFEAKIKELHAPLTIKSPVPSAQLPILREVTNTPARFENTESTTASSLKSPNEKENQEISEHLKRRMIDKLDLYKRRKNTVLRGHPVLVKIRERSRSKSPSKLSGGIISVFSDDDN